MRKRSKVDRRTAVRLARSSAAAACVWAMTSTAHSQEAVRTSIANEQSSSRRRSAASSIGYYNVKMGDTAWVFTSGLAMAYTDNVQMAGNATGADFYFEPRAGAEMRWPITDKNTLDIAFEGGYLAYIENTQLNRFFLNPKTEIAFDMRVGDFLVNLHERPYLSEYSYQDPTLSGQGNYTQFQNTAGLAGTWDLNQLVLRAGYDHVNYIYLNTGNNRPDAAMELFYLSGGYQPKPGRMIGLETGVALVSYDTQTDLGSVNGGTQFSIGPLYTDQLTEHIKVSLRGGYTTFVMDVPAALDGLVTSQNDGFYLMADLSHQIHERVSYRIGGGQQVTMALYGGNYENTYVFWAADWRINEKLTLTTPVRYTHYKQLSLLAGTADEFDFLTAGVTLTRPITEKLQASLGYEYVWKDSGAAIQTNSRQSYTANRITLNLSYRF